MKVHSGSKFGFWITIKLATSKTKHKRWLCRCDCGTEREVFEFSLKSGESQSCGCKMKKGQKYTRDDNQHRLLSVFKDIHRRCNSKNRKDYKHYGGRGVKVCPSWSPDHKGFRKFLSDIGDGFEEGLEIERVDVDGDYCKENCTWVNRRMQTNNLRANTRLEYMGLEMTSSEWSELTSIPYKTLKDRRGKLGWDEGRSLTEPYRDKSAGLFDLASDRHFKRTTDWVKFRGIDYREIGCRKTRGGSNH